jgi:hypothetical protein
MTFSSAQDRIVAVVPIGHNLRLEVHICNDGVAPSPVVLSLAEIPGTSSSSWFAPYRTRQMPRTHNIYSRWFLLVKQGPSLLLESKRDG